MGEVFCMKIRFRCMECTEESFGNLNIGIHYNESPQDFLDDYLYDFTCKNGHENHVALSNHKYELLFDSGICALDDGYYREAVADFAASLERFYEFCIRMILISTTENGIENFNNLWKEMYRQSERQYGAFVALYTSFMGKAPETLKNVDFRNNIIHKGEFPSKEKTLEYAKYVSERIKNIYSALEEKCEMWQASFIIADKVFKSGKHSSSTGFSTFLSRYISSDNSFEEVLDGFRKNLDIFYLK